MGDTDVFVVDSVDCHNEALDLLHIQLNIFAGSSLYTLHESNKVFKDKCDVIVSAR